MRLAVTKSYLPYTRGSLFLHETFELLQCKRITIHSYRQPLLVFTHFISSTLTRHCFSTFTLHAESFFPFSRTTMKPSPPLNTRPIRPSPVPPTPLYFNKSCKSSSPNGKAVFDSGPSGIKFPVTMTIKGSRNEILLPASTHSSSSVIASNAKEPEAVEENIEKVIYRCRFMTLLGVFGSLIGSFLCFIKGCTHVVASFTAYFINRGKVILLLVEAIDVYLLGTVMLVFGMGLYELFVSNLDIGKLLSEENARHRSNLFGLFALKERPRWLEIKSVNELKTKLGHVIVMLLLIGLFDKSKKAVIHSPLDLLCFSASVLLSSACLFLLSKLNGSK